MRLALPIALLVLLPAHLRAQRVDADSAAAGRVIAQAHDASNAVRPSVQLSRTAVGHKDPGTAALLGVLFPGAGQMYAGRTGKGLGLLALSAGAVVGGAAASSSDKCTTSQQGNILTMTCTDGKRGPLYAGIGVAVASWLYGAISAGGDARDANEAAQRHARATPIMEREHGRMNVGLAYRI